MKDTVTVTGAARVAAGASLSPGFIPDGDPDFRSRLTCAAGFPPVRTLPRPEQGRRGNGGAHTRADCYAVGVDPSGREVAIQQGRGTTLYDGAAFAPPVRSGGHLLATLVAVKSGRWSVLTVGEGVLAALSMVAEGWPLWAVELRAPGFDVKDLEVPAREQVRVSIPDPHAIQMRRVDLAAALREIPASEWPSPAWKEEDAVEGEAAFPRMAWVGKHVVGGSSPGSKRYPYPAVRVSTRIWEGINWEPLDWTAPLPR